MAITKLPLPLLGLCYDYYYWLLLVNSAGFYIEQMTFWYGKVKGNVCTDCKKIFLARPHLQRPRCTTWLKLTLSLFCIVYCNILLLEEQFIFFVWQLLIISVSMCIRNYAEPYLPTTFMDKMTQIELLWLCSALHTTMEN